jgi:hypothetical protein
MIAVLTLLVTVPPAHAKVDYVHYVQFVQFGTTDRKVGRFEIAMQETDLVQVFDGLERLAADAQSCGQAAKWGFGLGE